MTQTFAANRRGHAPTLLAAFLHFDVSFMLWVLLGTVREASSSFGPGVAVLAGLVFSAVVALALLAALSAGWRASWAAKGAAPILVPARPVLMAPYLQP